MRVAVIGSGVAGLTAAYILAPHARGDAVRARRAPRRPRQHGRRACRATAARSPSTPASSSTTSAPTRTLLRLFAELGVATQASDMSFGVRCEGCGLEYAGARGLPGVVPHGRAVLGRPRYLRMLVEVRRFHRHARAVLADPAADRLTLGEFLRQGGYSRYFADHFMLPLTGAVWSSSPGHDPRVPGPLPDPLLRQPRHADGQELAAVADGDRWQPRVRGPRSPQRPRRPRPRRHRRSSRSSATRAGVDR